MLVCVMRIISGKYRGKKLSEYSNQVTRPTKDRVREGIFNILAHSAGGGDKFKDAAVLDLFAGCGAYGLECHSRGAGTIVFNDADLQAAGTVKQNCKAINCNAAILDLDFRDALEKLKTQKFDLVFLDPPYDSNSGETAIEIIKNRKLLAANGVIIFETEKTGLEFKGFDVRVKSYGRVQIYFINDRLLINDK